MNDLIKLMRLFGEPGFIGTTLQRQEIAKGADKIEQLEHEIKLRDQTKVTLEAELQEALDNKEPT